MKILIYFYDLFSQTIKMRNFYLKMIKIKMSKSRNVYLLGIRLVGYGVLAKPMVGDMFMVGDTMVSAMWYIRKVIFWVVVS